VIAVDGSAVRMPWYKSQVYSHVLDPQRFMRLMRHTYDSQRRTSKSARLDLMATFDSSGT